MPSLFLKSISIAVLLAAMAFAGALIALIERGVSPERSTAPAGPVASDAATATN